jgi:Family of unknown function (DUF6433)
MKKMMYEILTEVSKAANETSRLEILKKEHSVFLEEFLYMSFNPAVEWNLPEGTPPYRESTAPVGMGDISLPKELRRIRNFIKGTPNEYNFTPLKKESIFIGILESLQKEEAAFLISVKNKSIEKDFPGVNKDLVSVAYPSMKLD